MVLLVLCKTADFFAQIQPGDIEVTSVADKVANGEIWILGGAM
jgi:hypothetical protein